MNVCVHVREYICVRESQSERFHAEEGETETMSRKWKAGRDRWWETGWIHEASPTISVYVDKRVGVVLVYTAVMDLLHELATTAFASAVSRVRESLVVQNISTR